MTRRPYLNEKKHIDQEQKHNYTPIIREMFPDLNPFFDKFPGVREWIETGARGNEYYIISRLNQMVKPMSQYPGTAAPVIEKLMTMSSYLVGFLPECESFQFTCQYYGQTIHSEDPSEWDGVEIAYISGKVMYGGLIDWEKDTRKEAIFHSLTRKGIGKQEASFRATFPDMPIELVMEFIYLQDYVMLGQTEDRRNPVWFPFTKSHIERFRRKGLRYEKILEIFRMFHDLIDKGSIHSLLINQTFERGIHYGEVFEYISKMFSLKAWRFPRTCFRIAEALAWAGISGVKISSQTVRWLDGLHFSKKQLQHTLADCRNWSDNRGFRLSYIHRNTIPDEVFGNRKIVIDSRREWLKQFGRIPQNGWVQILSPEIICSLKKSGNFKYFLRTMSIFPELDHHQVIAAAKLAVWHPGAIGATPRAIHDAGINLPEIWSKEGVALQKRENLSSEDLSAILANTEFLATQGISLRSPIEKIRAALTRRLYNNVLHPEFAAQCSKFSIGQYDFDRWQKMWMDAITSCQHENIPGIDIQLDGGYKLYRLDRNDPRGLFLGLYTNCCQHPSGAGKACAWEGVKNPDCCFYVLEKHGTIIAQSWLYRDEKKNGICFDSIETLSWSSYREKIEQAFYSLAKKLVEYGFKSVTVGSSGLSIPSPYLPGPEVNKLHGYSGYTDAHSQHLVFGSIE